MTIAGNVKNVLRYKTGYTDSVMQRIYNACTGIEMQYLRCFKRLGRTPINSPKELLLHKSSHLYITPLGVYHLPENRGISIYTQGPSSRLKSNALSAYNKRWYAAVGFMKSKLDCNIERGKTPQFDSETACLYIPLSINQLRTAKHIYDTHRLIILAITSLSPDILKITYITIQCKIYFEPKDGYIYKQSIVTDDLKPVNWYKRTMDLRTASAVSKRLNTRSSVI